MENLRTLLRRAEVQLQAGPHPDRARQDAETLVLHILNQNRAWLLAHYDQPAPLSLEPQFSQHIHRRQTGEPLQYITGHAEFFGLPFHVTPAVLIPRPETEHLVEEALRLTAHWSNPRIADIGSGSGAIAIALAHTLPGAHITATDLSPSALTIAQQNARGNHVENRIDFREGDLLAPLIGQQFEIIASNPPYIPTADQPTLSVEVRDHEPHSALFAGPDGLSIYQRLIPAARQHLAPNGWLVLEIGYNQQPAIQALLQASGYQSIRILPDYQGIPRVASAQLSEELSS